MHAWKVTSAPALKAIDLSPAIHGIFFGNRLAKRLAHCEPACFLKMDSQKITFCSNNFEEKTNRGFFSKFYLRVDKIDPKTQPRCLKLAKNNTFASRRIPFLEEVRALFSTLSVSVSSKLTRQNPPGTQKERWYFKKIRQVPEHRRAGHELLTTSRNILLFDQKRLKEDKEKGLLPRTLKWRPKVSFYIWFKKYTTFKIFWNCDKNYFFLGAKYFWWFLLRFSKRKSVYLRTFAAAFFS